MFGQQPAKIQAGPMLGHSDLREVTVWVQSTAGAEVQIRYRTVGAPDGPFLFSEKKMAAAPNFFSVKIPLTEIKPSNRYRYDVLLDGKVQALPYPTEFATQALWQHRTDPPPFAVALGSCTYINEPEFDRPGNPYGGDYQIFGAIHQKRPDAMLWLGDNVYLREADWGSRTGVFRRYSHTRATPEMQPLLASTFHYAIWDDHDFGSNDSDGTFPFAQWTREAFETFWANPTFGLPGTGGKGITTAFRFNDVDFFLLDNRTFRSPNECTTCTRTLLGKDQLEWLIGALRSSRAPFKIVCIGGQVLSTAAVHENYARFFPEEREVLLKRISDEKIKGVVFLTGDRHHSECSRYQNEAGNWVHDFTVSPLTSGLSNIDPQKEPNAHRVEGSLFVQRLFGLMEFTGPKKDRSMKMGFYDSNGKEIWNIVLKASDL